jgi:hypothetical protein
MTEPRKKHPGGRPRTVDRDAIIDHIAKGGTIAALVERGIISSRLTMWRLLETDEEFRGRYARAEAEGAAAAVEEAQRIVDTATPGEARVAELRARHRYWVASRRDPKRWGDRQAVEHSGPGGGPVGVIAIPVRAETPAGT